MKTLLFVIGVGIVSVLVYGLVAMYHAYMTRYRQKLERMTDDELKNEADGLYNKIARFSAFFEFGQNFKRYEAVLDELEKRGFLNA